jgi:hypothetical protein
MKLIQKTYKPASLSSRYLSQSTYIYRVPQCKSMFPRRNWDSPTPSPPSECVPPPRNQGGGAHTRLRVRRWRSPNSDDWRKKLRTLPTLWYLCTGYLCTRPLRRISKNTLLSIRKKSSKREKLRNSLFIILIAAS